MQQQYEQLIESINLQKQQQENIKVGMQKVLPKIESEIRPLLRKRDELSRKILLRLGEVADEIGVGKFNKEWFDDYMVSWAAEMLTDTGTQDTEVKAIFNKYSNEESMPQIESR